MAAVKDGPIAENGHRALLCIPNTFGEFEKLFLLHLPPLCVYDYTLT
jgi:hypothetical protein